MAIQKYYAHTYSRNAWKSIMQNKDQMKRLHPQTTRAVSTSTDTPRLPRVPVDIEDTQLAGDLVALEDLERNDAGVAEHVACDAAVEDLQGAVVTSVGEQRVAATGVEFDSTDSLAMVPQSLVRALRQIQIVPEEATVVRADNDVVTA